MISTTAIPSYRSYLTERIAELAKTRARYKEVEGQTEEELYKTGLNSSAACIWDMKAEAERMLQVFDLEFGDVEKPYKVKKLYLCPGIGGINPEITIIDNSGVAVNFEMSRINGENISDGLTRLFAAADRFYECSMLDEPIASPEIK